jgi:hypothetical protein
MDIFDVPDYNYFIRNLQKTMARHNIEEDSTFDWDKPKGKELRISKETVKSLTFVLPGEKELLSNCYEPYCSRVELE